MKHSDKIVTRIPLQKIWKDKETLTHQRIDYINVDGIAKLMESSPIRFVVADIGNKLKWIDQKQCFVFWKSEIKPHIVEDLNNIILENYPGNYVYIGSQWINENNDAIILFEKVH